MAVLPKPLRFEIELFRLLLLKIVTFICKINDNLVGIDLEAK
jgi:hypothetical protein